ncbi:MAG TPA: AAA domain-containing protein [Ferruginibacter sp.]|nr:AAA family ATPase [Bacteroidota bacterium]MBS1926000.1 AAA family ATPase [Bacteroidota bacterium]HMT95560.1 AAA domain-containing protein [Ferruginibacter sp.]
MHPQIELLLRCIKLEEAEEQQRYGLNEQHSLKQLKAESAALHPLIITGKNFGYLDYPELRFKLNFPSENNLFKDGAAIECFKNGEENIKGVLMNFDGKAGEFRLFAPDYPDWIEDDGVGIKLAPDSRTTEIVKKALLELENNKSLFALFESLHSGIGNKEIEEKENISQLHFKNMHLNASQQKAVTAIVQNDAITIVHGPPGTGKTTTLIEAIVQLVNKGEKVLVSAPSNTAVDHLAKGLLKQNISLLRVGNSSKADEALYAHTPEGKLSNSKHQKEVKKLKIRAEEFRKMALKYKRSFGKAEREQRSLLFKEVKEIRRQVKELQNFEEQKLFEQAQVIAATPIGLYDAALQKHKFDTLIIDEAGQCIEPLAWVIFPLADRWVLAGDHWQLPPTVLSNEAAQLGFNKSILETAIANCNHINLLDIQYRMRKAIAGFSSDYFYEGLLQTAGHLLNTGVHLSFIDMAGSGNDEERGADGLSLQNKAELQLAMKLMETEKLDLTQTAFISPYAGQVAAAKEILPKELRMSTIDSFQGQEKENIILSLVRSNDDGVIGFLKDYRRMNVAVTRAKEQLFVIGDSATIGRDKFYRAFLDYVEKYGSYRTVWEFEL